jgi:conjugal transfer pilus assembly protein TraF
MKNKFLWIMVILISDSAYAFKFTQAVCKSYNLGSNWYCEREQVDEQGLENNPQQIMQMKVAPEQKAEMLNQLWEVQRKRAVITGKKEDLEKLLVTQAFIAQKGTDFARNMIRTIEMNPLYSNSQSYYKNISSAYIESQEKENLLKGAKNQYSLALVYSSTCPYCKRQLPIIASFKEEYGINVIGVSVDGGFYDGLDVNVHDESAENDPNVKAYPTILLLDNKNAARVFVAKGLTTKDDLENRIYKILQEKKEQENAKVIR